MVRPAHHEFSQKDYRYLVTIHPDPSTLLGTKGCLPARRSLGEGWVEGCATIGFYMKDLFVYILRCSDNSYYIGRTNDIEKRLAEHKNKQGGNYTALRLPVELVFIQSFANENESYSAEQQLKGWSRKKKKRLLRETGTRSFACRTKNDPSMVRDELYEFSSRAEPRLLPSTARGQDELIVRLHVLTKIYVWGY